MIVFKIDLNQCDEVEVTDKFGRKWRLIPVQNENITMPFIAHPISVEAKK